MNAEIVPFGKYKGQPVEVLAADADYCEWLTAQPWFKARYLNVYNTVINYGAEPQDSPEHNQMQARFLDDAWCFRLADLLRPGNKGTYGPDSAHKVLTADAKYRVFREHCELEESDAGIVGPRFEDQGWDVTYGINPASIEVHVITPCTCRCDHGDCQEDASCRGGTGYCSHSGCPQRRRVKPVRHCDETCFWSSAHQLPGPLSGDYMAAYELREWLYDQPHYYAPQYDGRIRVELKPDLGDDYPSVLRQVKGYPHDGWRDKRCVVVRRHAFQAVTWEQVQKIFATSQIALLAESEIEC